MLHNYISIRMSFSNFNDALSSNNYCNPNEIGIDYETFKDSENVNFQLPLDASFKDFNIQKPIDESETNFSRSNTKLTHRECVDIYKYPNACSEAKISNALKHVLKCETCRKEIRKTPLKSNKDKNNDNKSNQSNQSNRSIKSKNNRQISDLDDLNMDESIDYKIRTIDKINKLSNVNKSILKNNNEQEQDDKYGKYKYDNDIKVEIDKKIRENFLKYQNTVLKEKIEKTEKDNDEHLENNKKIEKLIKAMNYNISQSAKLNSLLTSYLKKNNENTVNKDTEIQISSLTSYNILIYCSIVIIILLVIDIIIRIVYTNSLRV
jgi:hypothetical protein